MIKIKELFKKLFKGLYYQKEDLVVEKKDFLDRMLDDLPIENSDRLKLKIKLKENYGEKLEIAAECLKKIRVYEYELLEEDSFMKEMFLRGIERENDLKKIIQSFYTDQKDITEELELLDTVLVNTCKNHEDFVLKRKEEKIRANNLVNKLKEVNYHYLQLNRKRNSLTVIEETHILSKYSYNPSILDGMIKKCSTENRMEELNKLKAIDANVSYVLGVLKELGERQVRVYKKKVSDAPKTFEEQKINE